MLGGYRLGVSRGPAGTRSTVGEPFEPSQRFVGLISSASIPAYRFSGTCNSRITKPIGIANVAYDI